MTKFKVGDKVRILHTEYCGCGLEVGTVHSVVGISGSLADLEAVYEYGERDYLCFYDSELELVSDNTLTVGQTYTSKNGHKWLCIASDGEYAHMRMDGVPHSAAYAFTTDGTNISQAGGDWNIDFGPVRQTITKKASVSTSPNPGETMHHEFMVTFDLVDGIADWDSASVTSV